MRSISNGRLARNVHSFGTDVLALKNLDCRRYLRATKTWPKRDENLRMALSEYAIQLRS
jgi:hypothetical protein